MYSSALGHISELQSATCHTGSRSVTCYPTQVNAPWLKPSQAGWYSISLPRRDGRLSWPGIVRYMPRCLPARRQSPIYVVTGPA